MSQTKVQDEMNDYKGWNGEDMFPLSCTCLDIIYVDVARCMTMVEAIMQSIIIIYVSWPSRYSMWARKSLQEQYNNKITQTHAWVVEWETIKQVNIYEMEKKQYELVNIFLFGRKLG